MIRKIVFLGIFYNKIELVQYISKIPEFQDPMLLKEYFRSYHFRKYFSQFFLYFREEEKMLEFWRKTISGLYKYVYETSTLTKHKIKSSFMISRVIPYGLDNIILELKRRGFLIPIEELKNRSYYKLKEDKMGWVSWGLWKVYSGTIGSLFSKNETIADTVSLVSTAYLKVFFRNFYQNLVFLEENYC